jgi:hypothetical protein
MHAHSFFKELNYTILFYHICSPRTARGIPEIKFDYFLIVPIHPRLQGGAFSAPAGKNRPMVKT